MTSLYIHSRKLLWLILVDPYKVAAPTNAEDSAAFLEECL